MRVGMKGLGVRSVEAGEARCRKAIAHSLAVSPCRLYSVAQHYQFIDFGYDAMLLSERWEGKGKNCEVRIVNRRIGLPALAPPNALHHERTSEHNPEIMRQYEAVSVKDCERRTSNRLGVKVGLD